MIALKPPPPDVPEIDPDDVKMCNCAGCNIEIVGESMKDYARASYLPCVEGRILGRPYCRRCLNFRQPPPGRGTTDGGSPWQENAVRDMEGE